MEVISYQGVWLKKGLAGDRFHTKWKRAEKRFEAGAVTLVQNANREVVEIRVEDCTLCNRISYLPRHDLEVKVDGELVGPSQYPDFNGWPGAIVFNEKNLMVLGVYYWSPDLREGE